MLRLSTVPAFETTMSSFKVMTVSCKVTVPPLTRRSSAIVELAPVIVHVPDVTARSAEAAPAGMVIPPEITPEEVALPTRVKPISTVLTVIAPEKTVIALAVPLRVRVAAAVTLTAPPKVRLFVPATVRELLRISALGTGPLPPAERLTEAWMVLAPRMVRLPELRAFLCPRIRVPSVRVVLPL